MLSSLFSSDDSALILFGCVTSKTFFVTEHQREFLFGYCYKLTSFSTILFRVTYIWTYYFIHITY